MLCRQTNAIGKLRARVLHGAAMAVTAVVIVAAVTSKLQGDTFDERIQAAPKCHVARQELSAAGAAVLESVAQAYAKLGRMPSYPEYLELLVGAKQNLTASDRLNLYWVFGSVQRPPISPIELHDLFRAERAALTSFSTRYEVRYLVESRPQNAPEPPAGEYRKECRFSFDGQKLLLESSDYRGAALQRKQVEAYDGQLLRGRDERPDGSISATIAKLGSRKRFFAEGNPLLCAKLLEGTADLQADEQGNWDDLGALAEHQFVYETPVKVGGLNCAVVGNENVQVFCAPKCGFAVVEQRMGEIQVDLKTGGYARSKSYIVLANSDFMRINEKTWLPRRSEFRWTKQDEIVKHYVVTVDAIEANPALPDVAFSGIIPDGAFVVDAVRNKTYREGAGDGEK